MRNSTFTSKLARRAAATVCVLSAAASQGADITFCYGDPAEEYQVYGFNKKESYDVAIRIADASYAGARVKGFSVPMPAPTASIGALSGWMSSELKLDNKVNAPDIAVKEATLQDGMLSVTFDEPYEIPAEGVYVGYSFNILELTDYTGYPVAVYSVAAPSPDGLYMHTSRSRLKWKGMVETTGAVSAMRVWLETQTGDYAMTPVLPPLSHAGLEEGLVRATFVNKGAVDASTIGYTYKIGDMTVSDSFSLADPIMGGGSRRELELPLKEMPEPGSYPFSLTVGTINGEPNGDNVNTATAEIEILPFIPVTRPLVEEFTGLGCAFCPRGYVAMEQLRETYSDLFVGMAYHAEAYESGCMVTMPGSEFPVEVGSFPNGTLNREGLLDPGYFTEKWPAFQTEFAPASVEVTLEWADEDRTELRAGVVVRFARPYEDCDYRLSVALVADGLSNPKWRQSNAYAGETNPYYSGPWWDIFTKGERSVSGLTFNDVVVYYKDVKGVEGSLPSSMDYGGEAAYECRVRKADILNIKGEEFINDGASIHAVGILLDAATGKVLNCNKSASLGFITNSIGETPIQPGVVRTEYYDLWGARVSSPRDGIFVAVETLSDGTVRHSKVRR